MLSPSDSRAMFYSLFFHCVCISELIWIVFIFLSKMSQTRVSLLYILVSICVISLLLFTPAAEDAKDTRKCTIEGTHTCGHGLCCCNPRPSSEVVANCSGLGTDLQYIPKIEGNLKILFFSGNYLPELSATTLSNITEGKCIRQVSITDSGVLSISKGAFEKLRCLSRLDLSDNKDMNISQLEFGVQFNTFDLNNVSLSHFPDIKSKTMKKLCIKNNLLTTLDLQALFHLVKLNNVDISYNRIQSMPTGVVVPHIRSLRWAENLLDIVPIFCPTNGTKAPLPRLKSLDLTYNAIHTVSPDSFSCLHELINLYLRGNAISILTTNMFSAIPKLRRLNLGDMGTHLVTIEPYAFNSSRLAILMLDKNSFDLEFGTTRLSFANLPKLSRIDLSNNNAGGKTNKPTILADRLSLLNNLVELKIQSANVAWIPSDLFLNCSELTNIDAMGNPIQDLKGSFMFARSLERLTISHTKIEVVRESDFPANVRATLVYLNMRSNPYTCSCDNIWFRNWLTEHPDKIELPYWPEFYQCISPIRNVTLVDFHPSVDSCQGLDDVMLGFLIAGSVVVFLALVTLIVFIVKWNRLFPSIPRIVNITERTPLVQDT